MKKIIKFCKNYSKLHNQTMATLVYVRLKMGKDLNKEFIEYDTDNEYQIEENQRYLILYFVGNKLIPFTSLRKLNQDNLLKYVEGEIYNIVVEEQK